MTREGFIQDSMRIYKLTREEAEKLANENPECEAIKASPVICGYCPKFTSNPDHRKDEWDGTCTSRNIGRNADSDGCTNPKFYGEDSS